MEELFAGCLGILGQILLKIMLRVIAGPVFCVISTPVVLVRAFFGPGTYVQNLKSDYRRISLATWFQNETPA